MKIDGIYSIREHHGKVFTDIVYEWESDIARMLDIPVIYWQKKHTIASHISKRLPMLSDTAKRFVFGPDKYYLRFVMNAMDDTPLFNHKSCIPVIIDYFVNDAHVTDFIRIYDKCEYVFITSRQAYDHLSHLKLPFKVVHFPLTISDRYIFDRGTKYKKKYQLALLGTQIYDGVLKGYVERFKADNPGFVYVYKEDGTEHYYTSEGNYVCDARNREEYFSLLRASKITIYSTPAVRGRQHTNGFDQVTPKFLEMIASQCQVILRYSDNSDARFFQLPEFSDSIETYEAFEHKLKEFFQTDFPENYPDYINKHCTSNLIKIIDKL